MAVVTSAQQVAVRPSFVDRFRMTRKERRNLAMGLAFISPWLIGFCVFLLYPIYRTIRISFTEYTGLRDPEWTGLENYRELLHDEVIEGVPPSGWVVRDVYRLEDKPLYNTWPGR